MELCVLPLVVVVLPMLIVGEPVALVKEAIEDVEKLMGTADGDEDARLTVVSQYNMYE